MTLLTPNLDDLLRSWVPQHTKNMDDLDEVIGNRLLIPYTPLLTAATTNPNLGATGTTVGRFLSIDNLVLAWGNISWSGTGVAQGSGSYRISLPLPVDSSYISADLDVPIGTMRLFSGPTARSYVATCYVLLNRPNIFQMHNEGNPQTTFTVAPNAPAEHVAGNEWTFFVRYRAAS